MSGSKMLLKHPLLNPGRWWVRPAARTPCPCCGRIGEHRRSRWFYRYARCRRCGSIFVSPRPSQAVYDRRLEAVAVENVLPTFQQMDPGQLKGFADRILYAAQVKGRGIGGMNFLDFGCGVGRMLLAAHSLGFDRVDGYEPSHAMTQMALSSIGETSIQVTNCLDQLDAGYDIIFCEDVIEHCLVPQQVLEDLFSRMNTGGILYLSTPVISGLSGIALGQAWWCAGPDDHLQLYTHRALRIAVESAGFKVVDCFTDTLIPWRIGPAAGRMDRLADRLWYRLNLRVAGKRTLRGDNLIVIGAKKQ